MIVEFAFILLLGIVLGAIGKHLYDIGGENFPDRQKKIDEKA